MRQAKNRELTVLFVTHAFGVPAKAGNELRVLNLAKWFSEQGYRVHIAWKAHPDEVKRVREDLEKIQVYPLWHGPSERRWAVANEKGLIRYEDEICPNWLVEQVESLEVLLQPDIVLAEYVFMSRCLVGSKAALKIIDTHDVFSRRKEMVEELGIKESYYVPPAIEAKMLARADTLLAIQEAEAAILRQLTPEVPVITCGVDFDEILRSRSRNGTKPCSAIIVASDNPANRVGVQAFFRQCWPLIKKKLPGASLLLVGGIGEAIKKAPPGVKIAGSVKDLSSRYEKCEIALNPIAAGTGLKIKSVEALAYGRPVVSFANGLEGINRDGNGSAYFGVHDWSEFAERTIQLLADPQAVKKAKRAAKEFALKEFASHSCYRELRHLLNTRFASNKPETRSNES